MSCSLPVLSVQYSNHYLLCLSNTQITFPHQVLPSGDLSIEDPLEVQSGNFTCTATNIHGWDVLTHTLTVHGKMREPEIIWKFIINFVSLILSSV